MGGKPNLHTWDIMLVPLRNPYDFDRIGRRPNQFTTGQIVGGANEVLREQVTPIVMVDHRGELLMAVH